MIVVETSALTKPLTAEAAETLLWVLLLLFKLSLVFIISLENIKKGCERLLFITLALDS